MAEKKTLTAQELLDVPDAVIREVPCPEFGAGVVEHIRSMTGAERDAWEAAQGDHSERGRAAGNPQAHMDNFRARFLTRCWCNQDGSLKFTADQAAALGRKNAKALDRLYSVARALNGVEDADVRALLGN